jgi:hypothetical protein
MATEYLSRTFGTPTAQGRWTLSAWVKLSTIFGAHNVFSVTGGNYQIWFDSSGFFSMFSNNTYIFRTNPRWRDMSGWHHVMVAVDTAAASTNKVRVYFNGREITSFLSGEDNRSTFTTSQWNSATAHSIGRSHDGDSNFFDGYMSDYYFVDGQQLTPSVFGETDSTTGSWHARSPGAVRSSVGAFGNNGFYLPFNVRTSTTTLGQDFKTANRSSNNDWTLNRFAAEDGVQGGFDNNFATMDYNRVQTRQNGAEVVSGGYETNGCNNCFATLAARRGKFYAEFIIGSGSTDGHHVGLARAQVQVDSSGWSNGDFVFWRGDGARQYNGVQTDGMGTLATNDIVGVAVDITNKTFQFYKNNVLNSNFNLSFGTVMSTAVDNGEYITFISRPNESRKTFVNFGQGIGVASNGGAGFSDANGRGKFHYQPPSGYLALCEENIQDESDDSVNNDQNYLSCTAYSGTISGSGQTQNVNLGMNLSTATEWLTLFRNRGAGSPWSVFDSVRGDRTRLLRDTSGTESTGVNEGITATSTGITITAHGYPMEWTAQTGNTYMVYAWANRSTDAKTFDVISYTGNGSNNRQISHNLGVRPAMIWVKNRSEGFNWRVYMYGLGTSPASGFFHTNSAAVTHDPEGGINAVSTSMFQLFTPGGGGFAGVNKSGNNYIAYVWGQIPGYCQAGTYVGNGSADGQFVYTGFRPKMIITKSGGEGEWFVHDSTRDPSNPVDREFTLNSTAAEYSVVTATSTQRVDFYSNGFKQRSTNNAMNSSGVTYHYIAWSEQPFEQPIAR